MLTGEHLTNLIQFNLTDQRFFINSVYVAKLNIFKYVPGRGKFTMKLIKFKHQGPSIASTFFSRGSGRCLMLVFTQAYVFIKFFKSKIFQLQLVKTSVSFYLARPPSPLPLCWEASKWLQAFKGFDKRKSSWGYIPFGLHGIRVWSAVTSVTIAGHTLWEWLPGIHTLPPSVTPTGVAI